jgi:hypothetical protein
MTYTREQYMNNECDHDTYYGQFVSSAIVELVADSIGVDRIRASTDEHMNDIPLRDWDQLETGIGLLVHKDHRKKSGEGWSSSTAVCIAKAAARRIQRGEVKCGKVRYRVRLSNLSIPMSKVSAGHRGDVCRALLHVELQDKNNEVAPYKDIDLAECRRYTEVSIFGEIWRKGDPSNAPSSWGQCEKEIREHWGDDENVRELLTLWERWHLGGMRAGCREQEDFLREHPVKARYPDSHFDVASNALAAAGLNPCRGYRYGTAWLVERAPEDVVKRVVELCEALGGLRLEY